MPDLNDLLRWSITNSTPATDSDLSTSTDPAGQLSLRFNPANPDAQSQPHPGNSALHHNDPQYRSATSDDISEVSTPGPQTPETGTSVLPGMGRRNDLNTDILDVIMGKSDSVVMKEKMTIAMDDEMSVDDRVQALDDFEMLVELIDNANNMAVLKLWEPLLHLLKSPHQPIIAHACWIMGTAVQNNLKAQAALYIHNALPSLLSIIYPPPSSSSSAPTTATRAKAVYALSSALKHFPLASSYLSSSSDEGYSVLARGVSDLEPVIRRKMAFMIGTLVMQSGEKYEGEIPSEVVTLLEERMKDTNGEAGEGLADGLKRNGVFKSLVAKLRTEGEGEGGDVEFEENAVRALIQALVKGGLDKEGSEGLREVWEKWGDKGRAERGLDGEDGVEIERALRLAGRP